MNEIVPFEKEGNRFSGEEIEYRQITDRGLGIYSGVLYELEEYAGLPIPRALRPPESVAEEVLRIGKEAWDDLFNKDK